MYKLTLDYEPKEVYVNSEVRFFGNLFKDGIPKPGVKVYLYINDTKVAEATTALRGYYEFKWIFARPGVYKVQTGTTVKPPPKVAVPVSAIVKVIVGAAAVGYGIWKGGKGGS